MPDRSQYYATVPKDRVKNLVMRKHLIAEAGKDRRMADALWLMCSRDMLFFFNYFVWLYEPRAEDEEPVIPFITWDFQDETMLKIEAAIGKDHLLIEKSRDMGATWMLLMVFFWRWLFMPYQSFLVASRNERAVDASDNPDCLFWKLDFALKWLPPFLKPVFKRTNLNLTNRQTNSVIDGVSTTGDLSRGGRRTAIMPDEFASVPEGFEVLSAIYDVTNSVFFNSTPKGMGNAFAETRFSGRTDVITLHWIKHPLKSAGLHYDADGKPHSPWYDKQCELRHPVGIAQELDIDYHGSDYTFFAASLVNEAKRHVREPILVGQVEYDRETGDFEKFREEQNGHLKLWIQPDAWDEMPTDRDFVAGVDVSFGTGASSSTLVVLDKRTGEKVAEYANSKISPEDFAGLATAICRWFRGASQAGAKLIWEANGGSGRAFGKKVLDTGYRNIWWRRSEEKLTKLRTDIPGWFSTKDGKHALLVQYRDALHAETCLNRSMTALNECMEYVVDASGDVVHSRSKAGSGVDPTGARANHGDLVIADALANRLLSETQVKPKAKEMKRPENSFFGRRKRSRETETVSGKWNG